jgi:hypothetical protein
MVVSPFAMPSPLHEAILLLFRNRPELAPELLRSALGVFVPAFTEVRVESAELNDVPPAEYRADLVVLLLDGKPVLAIVVEVQLSSERRKRFSWPAYLCAVRSRFECPTYLLVVASDEAVATWAAKPIEIGPPGFVLRPFVLGPQAVPVITETSQAKTMPELAVLSAIAHGRTEAGLAVALAALAASAGLDEEKSRVYADMALGALSEAMRRTLEAIMRSGTYEYQSDIAKKFVAEGVAEGKLLAKAQDVVAVLQARGISITEPLRQRILDCNDVAVLDRWLMRAAVANEAGEVFDERKS